MSDGTGLTQSAVRRDHAVLASDVFYVALVLHRNRLVALAVDGELDRAVSRLLVLRHANCTHARTHARTQSLLDMLRHCVGKGKRLTLSENDELLLACALPCCALPCCALPVVRRIALKCKFLLHTSQSAQSVETVETFMMQTTECAPGIP